MKVAKTADWRDGIAFDVPMSVAELVPGEPTRCFVCGSDSQPRERSELWAVKHRHPHHHDGYVRFYCREHVPAAPRPVVTAPVAAPRARRPAAARSAPAVERTRPMCPNCFIEVSAAGLCGVCGETIG